MKKQVINKRNQEFLSNLLKIKLIRKICIANYQMISKISIKINNK